MSIWLIFNSQDIKKEMNLEIEIEEFQKPVWS